MEQVTLSPGLPISLVETSATLFCSLKTPPPFFPLPFMVVRPVLQSKPLPCFSRFLSASFTAVASSKPLACLGVHLVEELD